VNRPHIAEDFSARGQGGQKKGISAWPRCRSAHPAALRPWVEAAAGHLVTYHDKPVRKINAVWRIARRAAGLDKDFVPYTIRHTMASELRAHGVPELEPVSSGTTCRISEAPGATRNMHPTIRCS
jgi:integrase